MNTINNEMDKLQDEEGIQRRPAAPDFASKHLEDDTNPVGTTTSRTSGRKHCEFIRIRTRGSDSTRTVYG